MELTVSLGPRLKAVADSVPEETKLGDIGTDHAYLPIFLYEQGKINRAIAVDVHKGPFESAQEAVKSRHLEGVIDVRLGDGLFPLQPGEVNTLTLAGMGGKTMLEILSARADVMKDINDLILQPQGAEGSVRLALLESWLLINERLVEEEGRIYVVMAFSKTEGITKEILEEKEKEWLKRLNANSKNNDEIIRSLIWRFGPLVLEQPNLKLKRLLLDHSDKLVKQIKGMEKSIDSEVRMKINTVNQELIEVENIHKYLF